MDARALTPLAVRQHDNVTRAQLVAAGWGRGAIAAALAQDRLHRRHAGVYGFSALQSPEGRWMAAVLATGAPLSHVSAAALHGLLPDRRIDVEVITKKCLTQRSGIVVHRTRDLPAGDVVRRRRIPATSPTRTVLDLAQTVPRDVLLEAAMEALHRGKLDRSRIVEADWRGRRGAGAMRALRQRLRQHTRSELEAAMRSACAEHGLPPPSCQHPIGRLHVDFAWPAHRLAVETDGWEHHRSREAFEEDRARDAWLATRGWEVLRFTWRLLLERPELVVAAVRSRLDPP